MLTKYALAQCIQTDITRIAHMRLQRYKILKYAKNMYESILLLSKQYYMFYRMYRFWQTT